MYSGTFIIIVFFTTTFRFPRKVDKLWITLNEIPRFFNLVSRLFFQEGKQKSSVSLFSVRICKLVKTNGWNFSFKYLKEAFRLTIHALAGTPTHADYMSVRVKVDRLGFPTIIPLYQRALLPEKGNDCRLVLSLLQVFRVFPTRVTADLGSIINPFSGQSKTLSVNLLQMARKRLNFSPKWGEGRGFISDKAGPNFKRATLGSWIDAFALLQNPSVLYVFLQTCNYTRSFTIMSWIILILMVGFPYYIVLYFTGTHLFLGKLSVVYDQAGKARVVAITNWWIQSVLRPLHLSIFDWLKTLPTDGTFDQQAPQKRLVSMVPEGTVFHSIDLTAATDRIPVQILEQILTISGLRGDLWRSLQSIPWNYRGQTVVYSVGQAMGAYSSWAMLATFNHFMVQIAANRAGFKTFDLYAVLGDDVVIANDRVAFEYKAILSHLGIGISEAKSLTSSLFCEFAKQYVGPGIILTPLGPGQLLGLLRYRRNIVPVVSEMQNLGFINSFHPVQRVLEEFITKRDILHHYFMATLYMSSRNVQQVFGEGVFLPEILFYGTGNAKLIQYSTFNSVLTVLLEESRKSVVTANGVYNDYILNYHRYIPVGSMRFFERILFIMSPGYWLYLEKYLLDISKAESVLQVIYRPLAGSWEDIISLYRTRVVPPSNLGGVTNREARNLHSRIIKIDAAYRSTISDLSDFGGSYEEGDFY